MFDDFLHRYDRHQWMRLFTWTGIGATTLLLLVLPPGLPPIALIDLVGDLVQLPRSWQVSGVGALLTFAGLLLDLAAWAGLGWVGTMLVLHHRHQQRLRSQFRHSEWLSTSQLPLAMSLSSGHSSGEALTTATIPRLRLPHKPSPLPATNPYAPLPVGGMSVAEIPTRPTRQTVPLATAQGLHCQQPLQVGVGWDSGLERRQEPNEDSLLTLQGSCTYHGQLVPFGLFVVADGMGGHEGGLEASNLAIQNMMQHVLQLLMIGNDLSDETLGDLLIGGVEWANRAIFQHAQSRSLEMGTTLTGALIVGAKAYIVNVGDSRTYLYRETSGLEQITYDHSLVASLLAFGQITPEELYTHPDRNKIYRSLGTDETVKIDLFTVELRAHDSLLLCSDGLWELVRDPTIERILRGCPDPLQASQRLIQTALRAGGDDNLSAIVVQVPRLTT